MNRRSLVLSALAAGFAQVAMAGPQFQEMTEWSRFFTDADAQGSIVVLDARGKSETTHVYNVSRAYQRY